MGVIGLMYIADGDPLLQRIGEWQEIPNAGARVMAHVDHGNARVNFGNLCVVEAECPAKDVPDDDGAYRYRRVRILLELSRDLLSAPGRPPHPSKPPRHPDHERHDERLFASPLMLVPGLAIVSIAIIFLIVFVYDVVVRLLK